ncbi:hypothetical protein H0H92_006182 [Tricholoma furcatifolium]|nr:hypothetical protein H0H92_006182 [Tricholoma furcatifolium]
MLPFRTLCLFAATTLVALTSATPLLISGKTAAVLSRNVVVDAIDVPTTNFDTPSVVDAVEHRSILEERAANQLTALPALLSTCQASLVTVQNDINAAISSGTLNVLTATPLLAAADAALTTLSSGGQLLVGQDITVILGGAATATSVAAVTQQAIAVMNLLITTGINAIKAIGISEVSPLLSIILEDGGVGPIAESLLALAAELLGSLSPSQITT